MNEESRPWQLGYELKLLEDITSLFDGYNRFAMSPFSQVTKNKVATWLSENKLRNIGLSLTTGKTKIKDPFVARTINRDTPVFAYNSGTQIGLLVKDDLEISRVSKISKFLLHFIHLNRDQGRHVWLLHWLEDRPFWMEMSACFPNLEMVGNKFSSVGEILRYAVIPPVQDSQGLLPIIRSVPTNGIDRATTISFPVPWDTNAVNQQIADRIEICDFQRHYSKMNAGNSWSAVSLRGYGPSPSQYESPRDMKKVWQEEHKNEDWTLQNTPLLKEFQIVDDLHLHFFRQMDCEIQRVRLMKLEPGGGELQRHTDQVDHELGTDVGRVARFHFPVITNPEVKFTGWTYYEGREYQYQMDSSKGWYLDIRKAHRAVNLGDTPRIHLVIDLLVTHKLRDFLFKQGEMFI